MASRSRTLRPQASRARAPSPLRAEAPCSLASRSSPVLGAPCRGAPLLRRRPPPTSTPPPRPDRAAPEALPSPRPHRPKPADEPRRTLFFPRFPPLCTSSLSRSLCTRIHAASIPFGSSLAASLLPSPRSAAVPPEFLAPCWPASSSAPRLPPASNCCFCFLQKTRAALHRAPARSIRSPALTRRPPAWTSPRSSAPVGLPSCQIWPCGLPWPPHRWAEAHGERPSAPPRPSLLRGLPQQPQPSQPLSTEPGLGPG
ncbi:unnamed protein product [Triticum turgidum subsp. durum]|uniref:Uncharacterized protein n=1 Tax=Triticum turgidum subsp. durum TaxID=4567 RepID=A0A9R1PW44_TRITD|nr:unnamed protein product [Triticum turgidum subsp. durum]